jgi:hypothetical protein
MTKYVQKSLEVDAVWWRGDNELEVTNFLGGAGGWDEDGPVLYTHFADVKVRVNDWIIRNADGGYHSCSTYEFSNNYSRVSEDPRSESHGHFQLMQCSEGPLIVGEAYPCEHGVVYTRGPVFVTGMSVEDVKRKLKTMLKDIDRYGVVDHPGENQ